jgi:glutamate-1-semialdehyde 2,1-aminomutase
MDDVLDDVLDEVKARYAKANPASAERHRAATAVLPGGNTRTVLHYDPFPLTFVRGEGPYLFSADGVRYTDFLGEFTAGLYGHSEPAIRAAIRSTLDSGLSFGGSNALEHRLAGLICARFPSMELVRFTNSGTEANLMALALALHSTGRRRVLAFHGGYHGSVLSFGDGPAPTNVPHDFVLGDYNDVEGTRALIRAEAGRLGAVLVEPMLGSGGCIPGTPAFLRMLREEAGAAGAVLIFDEVMTSRLGPGGVQGLEGVRPDLTTVGKYLAGGMSFGGFGGRRELMAHFDPGRPGALSHPGTFNNNVLSMAAGIAGLTEVLTDESLIALNTRGDRLRQRLNDAAAARDVPIETTGRGSLMALHHADPRVRELLFFGLLEAGFWTARRGLITLSLPITDEHCDAFVAAFEAILPTVNAAIDAR